jgi:hypothetical protein
MILKLSNTKIKQVQKVVGSILYYARVIDITLLMTLSTIASKQITGTECTIEKAWQILENLATHLNATMHFQASNMIMNTHSNASYLSEPKFCSRACGHFF